jgi:hypothetical protein
MRRRWLAVAELAAVLFAINVVTRLVVRFGFDSRDTAENNATMVMFALIGVVLAVVTFLRSRMVPPATWLPEITVAALTAMLLTILVGPFISGNTPFDGGAGNFFSQVWLYGGFAIVGTLLGYWTATALGVDHRSKLLHAYARAKMAKPRRVVRR